MARRIDTISTIDSTGTDTDDSGRSASRDSSTDSTTREETEISSSASDENTPLKDSTITIEAPVTLEVPKQRGRPRKLTTEESSVPSVHASKRAQFYITTLRDLWMDLHGFAGIIDDELRWTLQESQRFADCAYEVCRARNWLRFLERASEARLIVLVLSIEMTKVQKVLEKQQPKPAKANTPPPQLVRSGQQNGQQTPPIDPNGVPAFTMMPRFMPEEP